MRFVFFIFITLISRVSFGQVLSTAQENEDRKQLDIYLAFGVNYSHVLETEGGELHGRVGFRAHKHLTAGAGAFGFFSATQLNETRQENYIIEGAYGGLFLEPILWPDHFVSITFPTILGIGQVAYVRQAPEHDRSNSYFIANDITYGVVPAVQVEMRLSRYIKLCISTHYRFLADVDITNEHLRLLPKNTARGWSAGVLLKIGDFIN